MCSLRLESSTKQHEIEIVPQVSGAPDLARCFMFYDFNQQYSSTWLDMSEAIFAEFGAQPDLAIGEFGAKQSKGNYRRVKKKLSSLLNAVGKDIAPDVRIDSSWDKVDEDFFPCDIRIAFSETNYGLRNGVVAIRSSLVDNFEELVERISGLVFEQTGMAYAHAFDFPACYGPDFYLSAVGAVPRGHSTSENRAYVERLTKWRDNTWHLGLRPSQGYLREVYPINFVLQTHLEKKINGRMFAEYMESVGNLVQVSNKTGSYRWDVQEDKLSSVRNVLETSGLILSAVIDK